MMDHFIASAWNGFYENVHEFRIGILFRPNSELRKKKRFSKFLFFPSDWLQVFERYLFLSSSLNLLICLMIHVILLWHPWLFGGEGGGVDSFKLTLILEILNVHTCCLILAEIYAVRLFWRSQSFRFDFVWWLYLCKGLNCGITSVVSWQCVLVYLFVRHCSQESELR